MRNVFIVKVSNIVLALPVGQYFKCKDYNSSYRKGYVIVNVYFTSADTFTELYCVNVKNILKGFDYLCLSIEHSFEVNTTYYWFKDEKKWSPSVRNLMQVG